MTADHELRVEATGETVGEAKWSALRELERLQPVIVDAAGYRERRRASLESLAVRSAERALATGEPVELDPMSAVERKLVHLRLAEYEGVETTSEGTEPNRYVV